MKTYIRPNGRQPVNQFSQVPLMNMFLQKGELAVPVGCEVLVRWLHKESVIPPDQFIPLAEQTGPIIPLTRQLIMDVTNQFAMSYKPENPFYISFNISARHLQSDMLENDLDYFLSRVDSNIRLVLEITEREIIASDDNVRRNIEHLLHHSQRIEYMTCWSMAARAVVRYVKDKTRRTENWLNNLLSRRNTNVAVVAMANKNARIIWALLAHGRSFEVYYNS